MAFLDNSGDIILDAVLTDAGRQRLARGQFKIVKFALGDEEINYSLYNSEHPSGSAFYDLEIMQTPILEAFTNNTSLMKSKLITINENNILYMPSFKLNNNEDNKTKNASDIVGGLEGYIITADYNTSTNGNNPDTRAPYNGVLLGDPQSSYLTNKTIGISIDTGIDVDSASTGLSVADSMPANLLETAFLVRVDDRMLRFTTWTGDRTATTPMTEVRPQFVDDDRIATYFFALGDSNMGGELSLVKAPTDNFRKRSLISPSMTSDNITTVSRYESFSGPLGSVLTLFPKCAPAVRNSPSLFDKMGTSKTSFQLFSPDTAAGNIGACKFIDTSINVVGVTTGQSIDIPIRIVKKT